MAGIDEVFSFNGPTAFDNEAPTNSTSIAERILDRGLDIADQVIRAKYGDRAAIPAQPDPRTAAGRAAIAAQQAQQAQSSFGTVGLIALVILIFLLISRR